MSKRNKEKIIPYEFGSKEMLKALYKEHGIKVTTHKLGEVTVVVISLPDSLFNHLIVTDKHVTIKDSILNG